MLHDGHGRAAERMHPRVGFPCVFEGGSISCIHACIASDRDCIEMVQEGFGHAGC